MGEFLDPGGQIYFRGESPSCGKFAGRVIAIFRQLTATLVLQCDSGGMVKAPFIALTLVLLVSQSMCAQQSKGSVCIASRADDPFWKEPIHRNGEIDSPGLRVSIDKRPAMAWPQKKSLKID